MISHFRIAHLSDLHLTAKDNGRRSEPKLPHQRLKGMNEAFTAVLRSQKIQTAGAIIVTGDITDKGDRPTWKRFGQLLKEAGGPACEWRSDHRRPQSRTSITARYLHQHLTPRSLETTLTPICLEGRKHCVI
ncbi:MAG: metallophosphoesterase [Proteobacteria bacterium]|nr:metallophosphoesterase [Pseudomonadota bacterium]